MKTANAKKIHRFIETFYGKKVTAAKCIYSITGNLHDAINLSFELEREYGIRFEDEIRSIKTISGLCKLTARKIVEKGGSI